ncbi:MAG: L-threonylcarbamoyladenylate synthase [Candidatus Woesearchaeota archaeon]
MRLLTKEEFILNFNKYIREIKTSVFIYPTDTIYGIGCNAQDDDCVNYLRVLKKSIQPFSIIPPDIDWINKNCVLNKKEKYWLKKLPGPYTLILKLKNKNAISSLVNNGKKTIGIRIPNHWFAKVVNKLGLPVISTSANISGQDFMTNIDNLHNSLKKKVDYIIYEGEKVGRPSTIVDLTSSKTFIKER